MYMDEEQKLEIIDSNGTKWVANFISRQQLSNFIDMVAWNRDINTKTYSKRTMVSDDDGNYFNPSHIFRMRRIYSKED